MPKTKKKKGFLDGYKTYDPVEGYGNVHQWRNAWENMSHGDAAALLNEEDPLQVFCFKAMPASEAELNARYRELIRKAHPDQGGSHEEAKRVIAAWTLLKERL